MIDLEDKDEDEDEQIRLEERKGPAIGTVDVCRKTVAGLAKARSGARNAALIPGEKTGMDESAEFQIVTLKILFTPLLRIRTTRSKVERAMSFLADPRFSPPIGLRSPDLGPHVHVIPTAWGYTN